MIATAKQRDFLTNLLTGKAHDLAPATVTEIQIAIEDENITKGEASNLIDKLVKAPWKCRKCGAPKNGRFCDACKGTGADSQKVEEGFYQYGKSEIAVVKFNRAKTNKYAMLLVADGEPVTIRWEYTQGLIGRIAREGWERMTLEDAKAFGALYGVCMVCGRTLTDPKSIEAGIGPICAGRF